MALHRSTACRKKSLTFSFVSPCFHYTINHHQIPQQHRAGLSSSIGIPRVGTRRRREASLCVTRREIHCFLLSALGFGCTGAPKKRLFMTFGILKGTCHFFPHCSIFPLGHISGHEIPRMTAQGQRPCFTASGRMGIWI
jgi:hypothetical protein